MSSTSTTWSTQGNTKAGASSTSTDSLTTGTLTADTIQLASNVIKASDGGNTITLNTSDDVTIAGDLTVSGSKITFGNGAIAHNESSNILEFSGENIYHFVSNESQDVKINIWADEGDDNADKVQLKHNTSGVTSFNSYNGSSYDNTIKWDASGNFEAKGSLILADTKKLHLDGSTSGDTYIMQNGADVLDIVVGGDTMMKFTEASTETIAMSAEKVQITGTASYQPNVIIENDLTSANSENPALLTFAKTGEAAADGDNIGRITFQAIQEGGSAGYANSETFAYIQGEVIDSVAGSEAGQIAWHIFSDGGDVTAMTLAGNASDSRCALTLGANGAGCDFKVFGETADSYMIYDQSADKLLIHSDNDGELLRVVCLDDLGDAGPSIGIKRNSASPANDDDIGSLTFLGQDSGGNEVVYGKISSSIVNVTDGSEEGRVVISCHNHNGGSSGQNNVGLRLTGKNDSTIDATIGYGSGSLSTVNGQLKVASYFAANGATPAAAPNYTVSNLSTDRALDCDSTSDAEVADVLGQVITDLIAIGIFQ